MRYIQFHEIVEDHFYKLFKGLFNYDIYPKDKLSLTAKVIYTFLRDRMTLSQENGWKDKTGNVYIIYTRESIAEELGVTSRTVISCMKELVDCRLIEEKRQGLGRPNLIYFGHVETFHEVGSSAESEEQEVKNFHPRSEEFSPQDLQTFHSIKTYNNKTNENKKNTELNKFNSAEQSSEKSQSTLFNLPKKEKPVKKSRQQTFADKVTSAFQGSVEWKDVTHTHLACFFVQRHKEVLGKDIDYNYNNHPPQFKTGFLHRYKLDSETAALAIEELLTIFSEEKPADRNGYTELSFNALCGNFAFMNRYMDRALKRLKRQTESSQRSEKEEPSEITENDIF